LNTDAVVFVICINDVPASGAYTGSPSVTTSSAGVVET